MPSKLCRSDVPRQFGFGFAEPAGEPADAYPGDIAPAGAGEAEADDVREGGGVAPQGGELVQVGDGGGEQEAAGGGVGEDAEGALEPAVVDGRELEGGEAEEPAFEVAAPVRL